jgi:hypothetical protein
MKLLLVASKNRREALEIIHANGEHCEIVPGGLAVFEPQRCHAILDKHNITSIIDE